MLMWYMNKRARNPFRSEKKRFKGVKCHWTLFCKEYV